MAYVRLRLDCGAAEKRNGWRADRLIGRRPHARLNRYEAVMRIEKFVHSCIRLSLDDERLLFDPGKFSFVDGRVTVAQLGRPSIVILTHGHPDHVDPNVLHQLAANGARIVGNSDVVARLKKEGLKVDQFDDGEQTFGPFRVSAVPVEHEPILSEETPATTAFLVNGVFLNPADSFDRRLECYAGVEALALPVMAPFLTELAAFAFAKRMRPRAVLPVHDGYARDYFLAQRYDAYEPYLQDAGIRMHRPMTPGDGFDL